MTQIYCTLCHKYQPLLIERMHKDLLNEFIWGDLLCSVCKLVITTLRVDEEGIYEFKKIERFKIVG